MEALGSEEEAAGRLAAEGAGEATTAQSEGTWPRLKACAEPACRAAFGGLRSPPNL